MKSIKIGEKEYNIFDKLGDMPAKRGMKIYTALSEYSAGKMSLEDYNFLFLSTVLYEPLEFIENLPISEFLRILTEINGIMSKEIAPHPAPEIIIPDEIVPEKQ